MTYVKTNSRVKELIQDGLRHFDRHEWKEALDLFAKAQTLNPSHPVPYLFSSLANYACGQIEKSKRDLDQGLKLRPQNVFAHNIAALHAFRNEQVKTALDLLKRYGLAEHPRIQAFLLVEIEKHLVGAE